MDGLYLATIFISLLSAVATVTVTASSWFEKVAAIELEVKLHMQEIEVLNHVLSESEEIIDYVGDELPTSIQTARKLCRAHRKILGDSLGSIDLRSSTQTKRLARTVFGKVKTAFKEDEWKKAFRVYRGSVFMLRELCADIKMHMQLRNMTAAMARLDEEFAGAPAAKDLVELQGDDFFVIAYIRAQSLSDYPNAERRAVPATLKLDTGADIDHVSQQFLENILELKEEAFLAIPEHEQEPVTGFDGTQYTPKYRIELQWSRQLNREMKTHMFLVIPNCPCDVVLGARNFLEQATGFTKRIQIAAGGKLSDSEQQRQDETIKAEQAKERAEFEEAKARRAKRSWTRRLPTTVEEDIEMQGGTSSAPTLKESIETTS